MNRRLVLTSEGAGHPFRRTLPPHVLRPLPEPEPEVAAAMARAEAAIFQWDAPVSGIGDERDLGLVVEAPAPIGKGLSGLLRRVGLTIQDAKDFLLAYCACFLAVSAFIS